MTQSPPVPHSMTDAQSPQDPDSQLRPITAVSLSTRVDIDALGDRVKWEVVQRYPYALVLQPDPARRLFLFRLGAVVLDGADRIDEELSREIQALTGCQLLTNTAETYFIAVEPGRVETRARVGWDRVTIPERSPELVAAIALLLGQSAALERYEHAADALLEETHELCRQLGNQARLPLGTKRLIERVGHMAGNRLELARWFYLVDRPAETWESPRVAALYDSLFANLELRQRHEAMLYKLNAAERATQDTLHMWHGRRSNALEWAIVLLIVIEIVFGFWGLM